MRLRDALPHAVDQALADQEAQVLGRVDGRWRSVIQTNAEAVAALEPPTFLVAGYGLVHPDDIAVARRIQDEEDAADGFDLSERRICGAECFTTATGGEGQP